MVVGHHRSRLGDFAHGSVSSRLLRFANRARASLWLALGPVFAKLARLRNSIGVREAGHDPS